MQTIHGDSPYDLQRLQAILPGIVFHCHEILLARYNAMKNDHCRLRNYEIEPFIGAAFLQTFRSSQGYIPTLGLVMDYLASRGNDLLYETLKDGMVHGNGNDLVRAFCQYTHCLMSNSDPSTEIEQMFSSRLCADCCVDTTGEFNNLIKLMQMYKG